MKFKKLVLMLMILCTSAIKTEVIIFDCGGVLVDVSKRKAFKWLGLGNLLPRLFANSFSGTKLRQEYMAELDRLIPLESPDHIGITDEQGNQLPALLCKWMLTHDTNEELLEELTAAIAADEQLKKNPSKARSILAIATNTLLTDRFIDTLYLREDVVSFLEACAQERDEKGNKRHRIYVLSNYNGEAFTALLEKFPRIKNNIDGHFVSGLEGCAKPNPEFYRRFIERFNIKPHEEVCYFIDDQTPNRVAGNEIGLVSVHPDAVERDGDGYYLWIPKQKTSKKDE